MPMYTSNSTVKDVINSLGDAGKLEIAVDKSAALNEMSAAVKYKYMKIFVSLLQNTTSDIDSQIGKLNILMSRIDCPPEVRRKIREALAEASQPDFPAAVSELQSALPYMEREGIKYAILKDAIWLSGIELYDKKPEEQLKAVERTPQLENVCVSLGITKEQLKVVLEAMSLDQAILSGKVSDSALEAMAKDLAAKASGVGVPLAALYLSGTMGLSAAGITSALATLGFGGLLGLSSMVTGIGVLVLVGVGIYQGVKYATGAGERDKISRRGLMLRLILQNQQKTIANMAEDVFDLTGTLRDLLADAARNQILIDKILARMAQIQAAAAYVRTWEEESKHQIAIEDGNANA